MNNFFKNFCVFHFRFLFYEVRAANSYDPSGLCDAHNLHTIPRWKRMVKKIISDLRRNKHMPSAKPEDIVNASIQVNNML